MSAVSTITSSIRGVTAGEHSGHLTPHPPLTITGNVSSGSPSVFINGLACARVGDSTAEFDACCGRNSGSIATGSATVFVNGRPIARIGDSINAHNGSASVTGGSQNVFAN